MLKVRCSIERDSLLRDPAEGTSDRNTRPFGERVDAVVQEPLTPLTKTLLVLALVLLLISSVCLKHAGQAHDLLIIILIVRFSLVYLLVPNID